MDGAAYQEEEEMKPDPESYKGETRSCFMVLLYWFLALALLLAVMTWETFGNNGIMQAIQ
jgi:hypothetical protein